MKTDVLLCGVGGQGVLTLAGLLAEAARRGGLEVRQGEIHGMSQRGGAVEASLRLAEGPIAGTQIPRGEVDVLLAMEPLEALRHVDRLHPAGAAVVAADPMGDIDGYPEVDTLLDRIRSLPRSRLIPAATLARGAGAARAANVVLGGAALESLPLDPDVVAEVVREAFAPRGPKVVEANLRALAAGRAYR